MFINNETIGISAEVAIAKTFDVDISPAYSMRASDEIVNFILSQDAIPRIFSREHIPYPIEHIAEHQNPIDFVLCDNKTLSVKTNHNNIGRAAPQIIGQPTDRTYFTYIQNNNIIPGFDINHFLRTHSLPDNYNSRAYAFKWISINFIDTVINMYWENMFDCDYLLLFYNLESYRNPINNYRVFGRMAQHPNWNRELFSFTQTVNSWNESNTLKYDGITIGNFQVHRNRNCFKFRFDMRGILRLLDYGLI